MKQVKGNLIKYALDGTFDVIIHGCNCHNVMGAGIAPQIAKAFPNAYQVDQNTIHGDKSKLGTISVAYHSELKLFIVNAYTQYSCSNDGVSVDYNAVEQCFKQIKTMFSTNKIGYPAIGCGLAGGDWNIVSNIIDNILTDDVNHTFVEFIEE